MNGWLIALVGVIYLAVGVNYWNAADRGMGIVFFGYALANVGLIIAGSRF